MDLAGLRYRELHRPLLRKTHQRDGRGRQSFVRRRCRVKGGVPSLGWREICCLASVATKDPEDG